MMNIEESNLIVKDVIYQNMVSKIGVIKNIDEFGYYKYAIYSDFNQANIGVIYFGFSSDDFSKIFDYSGKEFIANDIKDFKYDLNVSAMNLNFSIVFKIDTSKYSKIFESK